MLSSLVGKIYAKYVVAMCQNSATKTSEIKELSELREGLGLDGLLMGEALYQVSQAFHEFFSVCRLFARKNFARCRECRQRPRDLSPLFLQPENNEPCKLRGLKFK